MEFLADQWLPILLSAAGVFVASSVIHMAIPIHRGDYGKLPGEANLLEAMRKEGVQRGTYMFPCAASMKDCGSPEMQEKFRQGPVGLMTVLPNGMPNMGKSLLLWFLYTIVVSILVAYTADLVLLPGAEYKTIFRVTSVVALMAYGVGCITDSIWKGVSWKITGKFILDGIVYAFVTAALFGWLWKDVV